MIIGDKVILEDPTLLSPETGHDHRFSRISHSLTWIRGQDLLVVGPHDGSSDLPRRPKPRPDAEPDRLWIPAGPDTSVPVGPIYLVRSAAAGGVARIFSDRPVAFVPDLRVAIESTVYSVLGCLDQLDPSSVSRIRRLVRKGGRLHARVLFPESGNRGTPEVEPVAGLPPAAKSILARIESAAIGECHVREFQKVGAMGLIRQLEERDLIVLLNSGQIVAGSALPGLRAALSSAESSNVQDLAAEFGTSIGTMKQIVRAFRDLDLLDSFSNGNYKNS